MAKPKGSKSVMYPLQVELDDKELRGIATKHVEVLNAMDAMLERHKDVKKKLKLEVDNAIDEERQLRDALGTGKATREVKAYEVPDFKKGVVVIHDEKNDKVIDSRKMTDEERQQQIEGIGPGASTKGTGEDQDNGD